MKHIICKNNLFTGCLIMAVSLTASAEISDTIEKTFNFDNNGKIQLSNINGDVTIKSCDCSELSLLAKVSASSQKVRDRISIEIDDSSSQLKVKTKYKNNHGSSWNNESSEVTYQLSVPNNVRLNNIKLVNGSLKIKGVTGELNAALVNGNIHSDGLTSSTKVNMVNGDMNVRFKNLDNAEDINFTSVNGNIKIYLPQNANATIDAETVSGHITNDFGIRVIKHKYVGSEMQGTIGSGDVDINLENVNGKILVKSL